MTEAVAVAVVTSSLVCLEVVSAVLVEITALVAMLELLEVPSDLDVVSEFFSVVVETAAATVLDTVLPLTLPISVDVIVTVEDTAGIVVTVLDVAALLLGVAANSLVVAPAVVVTVVLVGPAFLSGVNLHGFL